VDDYRQIAADLFALEDDPKDIRDFVRDGLATLSRASLVVRYEIDGKRYFYISSWDRHQRVDRPNKPRYPRPPDGYIPPTSPDDLKSGNADPDSRDPRDTFATPSPSGTEEQGNRGTGEVPPTAAHAPTADILVAEWLDHCRKRPPNGVIGQTSKLIKAMLGEGLDPDDIRRGLGAWLDKGLHPSALPSVVNEVMNAAPIRPPPRTKPTADDRYRAIQELKTGTGGQP
jgi:hypothetical protein